MDEEFEQFWKSYPRKTAKGDARKAWKQTEAIRPDITDILSSLQAAKKTEQWCRDHGQYIPYPATWLRQERWEDCAVIEVYSESAAKVQKTLEEIRVSSLQEKQPMPDSIRLAFVRKAA